jgi:hypothetical protein
MKKNVVEMTKNVNEVEEKLLPTTIELAREAKKFDKGAGDLEKEAKRRNFWAGSPKCVIIFGGGGALIGIITFLLIFFLKMKK